MSPGDLTLEQIGAKIDSFALLMRDVAVHQQAALIALGVLQAMLTDHIASVALERALIREALEAYSEQVAANFREATLDREAIRDLSAQIIAVLRQWYPRLTELHSDVLRVRSQVEAPLGATFAPPPPALHRTNGTD